MNYKKKVVIGDCVLYHADCMDILPHLENVDAVVTDPPYEGIFDGGGTLGKRRYKSTIQEKLLDIGFDYNILNNFSRFSVFCSKQQLSSFINYCEHRKLNYTVGFWGKKNPTPLCNNNFLPDVEYVIHAGAVYGSYKEKSRFIITNVIKNNFNHPTVKPLNVVQKFLINISNQNEIILDPFMGTGTTGVVCVKENRKFIGIELDEEYFEIACKRIKDAYDTNEDLEGLFE